MSRFNGRRARLIFARDFQEYRKNKILVIILIVLAAAAVACGIGMTNMAGGENAPADPVGQQIWVNILGTVMILFAIIPPVICIPVFATKPLTYEKANGVVMSLITTETTPAEIWTGKGLAIFLPGLAGSYLAQIITLPFFFSIVPLPATVLLCSLVVMPLAMYFLSVITVQLSMIKSVDLAISPSYVCGFLLMALFPIGAITGLFCPGTTAFLLVCLGVLAATFIAERILAANTTIEKIILA